MILPLSMDQISKQYEVDANGKIRMAMNALFIETGDRKILIDPGTADFLPSRLYREYEIEVPHSIEAQLEAKGLAVGDISDVVFTHLHFDHASGGFSRIPGAIVKRFPEARYHVLKAHYEYALEPDAFEADAFCTGLFKYLDKIHWIEDWDIPGIDFRVYNGHTRGLVVPSIQTNEGKVIYPSDLLPLGIFTDTELWCGYDLDKEVQLREKQEFLQALEPGTRIMLVHDTLTNSVLY